MNKIIFSKSDLTTIKEMVLEELVGDELTTEEDDSFFINEKQLLKISDSDRAALGLPPSIPFKIHISGRGTLNETNFSFSWKFIKHRNGESLPYYIEDYVYNIDGKKYYPSTIQHEIFQLLNTHERLSNKSYENNLETLGRIKSLNGEANSEDNIHFDSYLENENVTFAEKIRLDVKVNSDESVNIVPSIKHKADHGFQKAFDIYPKVKSVYNTQTEEGKYRVVIPEEKVDELIPLKQEYRKISGEKKESILKNPTDYFDENQFDLDHYSKRVYELGFYEPKFYPFIKPYKTDWVSGVTIEEASGNRVDIFVENENEYEELVNGIEHAKEQKLEKVTFKDRNLPIQDAVSLRDSFEAIKEKRVSNSGFRDSQGKKVLIIHENIEDINYSTDSLSEITHVLKKPLRLKKEFNLMPHQQEGVAWLQSLSKANSGALLADDMGLGKTLQVLSFLDWTVDHQEDIKTDKPNLLVAPVTLLENWENEYSRFFENHSKIIRYYGKSVKEIDLTLLGKKDIVLTTYETLRSKQLVMGRVNWFSTVLDEAQRIKTPGTMVTNAAKALNAEFKIAMTGTPVENSWMDLWCISDFIAPGLLGSGNDFNRKYNLGLKEESADIKTLGDDIRSNLGVYLKRRTKSQILKDLPTKKAYYLPKAMPTAQEEAYLAELDHYRKNSESLNQILSTINKIRMISDHPYLDMDPEELLGVSIDELINTSAKIIESISILEDIRNLEEKVIIFSHFDKVQRILQRVVLEYFGLQTNIINGQTSNIDAGGKVSRQKLIDRFQAKEGFNIIIMSPIAAGYGLNVTGANHVIHYTRHWNPAKENQATDRVYRIGQNKPVSIYYPMAIIEGKETFDLKLDNLLQRKNQLSEASLYPSEACEVKFSEFEDLIN